MTAWPVSTTRPLTSASSASGPSSPPAKAFASSRACVGVASWSTNTTVLLVPPRRREPWAVTLTTLRPCTGVPSIVDPASSDQATSPVQCPSSASSSTQQGHTMKQSQASMNEPVSV